MMLVQDTSTIQAGDLFPLADVKAFLRVDGTDDDDLIGELTQVATEQVQAMSNTRAKTVQAYGYLEHFHNSNFPVGPVVIISAVHYKASGDTYTELSASKYHYKLTTQPGRIEFINYPSLEPDALHRVRITFQYGYDQSQYFRPAQYKQAVMMLVAHMYDNRMPAVVGRSIGVMPMHVEALVSTFRQL